MIGSGPKAGTVFAGRSPDARHGPAGVPRRRRRHGHLQLRLTAARQSIEITGTEGTLLVPDPNQFDGPCACAAPACKEAEEIPATGTDVGRGIGVLDMARALRTGAAHRASGELALHVLDVMAAITASARGAAFLDVPAWTEKLEALPEGWDPLEATL